MPTSLPIPRELTPPPPKPRVEAFVPARRTPTADRVLIAVALAFIASAAAVGLGIPGLSFLHGPAREEMRGRLALALLACGVGAIATHAATARWARRSSALRSGFQAIVGTCTDAVVGCDARGHITVFNPAAERLLGWRASEILGQSLTRLLPERYHSEFRNRLSFLGAAGSVGLVGESRVLRAMTSTGDEISVEAALTGWDGERGPEFAAVLRDAGTWAKIEAQLRLSEQLLRQLPEAIVLTDVEGRIVRWMGRAEQVFGFSSSQVTGTPIDRLLDPTYRAAMTPAEVSKLRRGEGPAELPFVRRDGTPLHVASSASVVMDGDGKRSYLVHIFRDVSERRRAEQLLGHTEEKFRTLVETAQEVIVTVSPEGLITSLNPAFERTLGWPVRDWLGRHYSHLLHPEDLVTTESATATALRGGSPSLVVARTRTRDGRWRYLETTGRPLVIGGRIAGVLAIARDVTERKAAEAAQAAAQANLEAQVGARTAELREANERLRREAAGRQKVAAVLAERTRQLESSNEDLERFAYVASHDLQEPLRMVTSYVQLLQEKYVTRLDADARQFIDYAVDGTRRMRELIVSLLEFSRRACREQEKRAVKSADALREAAQNLSTLFRETGGHLEEGELPEVTADPTQLTEIFQNLVGNALKYRGADPPRIRVEARQAGGAWEFHVSDNGIGIDPRYQERIFLPFRRGPGADRCAGTGIGLAICKRIVERHGGRIGVRSEAGKGSTFIFSLPATSPAGNAAEGKEE